MSNASKCASTRPLPSPRGSKTPTWSNPTTKTTMTTGSTRKTCLRANRSQKTSSATCATSATTERVSAQEVLGEGFPEAGRHDERVHVDALVVAVKHRRVVVERQLAAEQAETVRNRAGAP